MKHLWKALAVTLRGQQMSSPELSAVRDEVNDLLADGKVSVLQVAFFSGEGEGVV